MKKIVWMLAIVLAGCGGNREKERTESVNDSVASECAGENEGLDIDHMFVTENGDSLYGEGNIEVIDDSLSNYDNIEVSIVAKEADEIDERVTRPWAPAWWHKTRIIGDSTTSVGRDSVGAYTWTAKGDTILYGIEEEMSEKYILAHEYWIETKEMKRLLVRIDTFDDITFSVLAFANNGRNAVRYTVSPGDINTTGEEDADVFDLRDLNNIKRKVFHIDDGCQFFDLVGDTCYFGVDDALDYAWGMEPDYTESFYKAHVDNPKERILISKDAKVRAMSEDGRYALVAKKVYLCNEMLAIIDTRSRRCAYLLRDSMDYKPAFWDKERGEFGVDCGTYIVYLKMPKEFRHSAERYLYGWYTDESWERFKRR